MFFSLSDMGFYLYFGSILYVFDILGIAFIGIHLLEDVVVPKRTKFCVSPIRAVCSSPL